jgi:hypothetical protein
LDKVAARVSGRNGRGDDILIVGSTVAVVVADAMKLVVVAIEVAAEIVTPTIDVVVTQKIEESPVAARSE